MENLDIQEECLTFALDFKLGKNRLFGLYVFFSIFEISLKLIKTVKRTISIG